MHLGRAIPTAFECEARYILIYEDYLQDSEIVAVSNINKWYFCINDGGVPRCEDLIKVAVRSCLANTSFEPVCLYGGNNTQHIQSLTDLGVRVIRHVSSFQEALEIGYGENVHKFSGHWLRVDIPNVEQEDDLILYTDTDVLFRKDIGDFPVPQYLSGAPEFRTNDFSKFNSGVMVMNLRNLRGIQDDFISSIRSRLMNDFQYPAHDQESFNRFFAGLYDRLDPVFNWKPYWGVNPNARIIHFHGPKQGAVRKMESGDFSGIPDGHVRLWKRDPNAYIHYYDLYNSYL